MATTLTNYLQTLGTFTAGQIVAITDHFTPVHLKKNQLFLREGQICKTLGFVEAGLLMYYKLPDNGREIVADFAQEKDWVSQYQSFIGRQPSALFIRTLEPCTVNTITLEGLASLYEKIAGFEKLSKQLIEQAFMEMVNRQLEFKDLRAEERYEKLLSLYPTIAQRIPQYYIASFLGIAPPSLSRIRKNRTS